MKTLYLTLQKKWYNMIEAGDKPEEYRRICPHWISQFIIGAPKKLADRVRLAEEIKATRKLPPQYSFQTHTDILFANGYQRDCPKMQVAHLGYAIGEGNPEWGAEPGEVYFILNLGTDL